MRTLRFLFLLVIAYCGATATYAQSHASGKINGHEYVDLGLSVKWATCNIGAKNPSDYGDYYAWGETKTKSSYTDDNCVTYGKDMGSIAGNPTYDAARAKWGGTWRLPTIEEIEELRDKCEREWTTQRKHEGYMVTGPNGNSIFLPAAGWREEKSLEGDEEYGEYWSALPRKVRAYESYELMFNYRSFFDTNESRYYGLPIRPVTE